MDTRASFKLLYLVLLLTTTTVCIVYYTKSTKTVSTPSLRSSRNPQGLPYTVRPARHKTSEVLQGQGGEIEVPSKLDTHGTLEESIAKDMKRCSVAMDIPHDVMNIRDESQIVKIANKAALFLKIFSEIVPKDFLSKFKNPCWYSNITISQKVSTYFMTKLPMYRNVTIPESDLQQLHRELYEIQHTNHTQQTLHCLPYFLLPAFPKSGTTTLHSALSHHPQIMAPERKEPQWWYKQPLSNKTYLEVYIAKYLTNFLSPSSQISSRKDGHSLVTYDASQTMMVNVHDSSFHIDHEDYCALPAVISRVLPKAKIIVLMREPASRIYSHYMYGHIPTVKWSEEFTLNPPVYFDRHITKQVHSFRQCLNTSSLWECVNQVRTDFKQLWVWLGVSVYYIHILKWLQFWPRENFLFLKTEDMSAHPCAALRDITEFLSLSPFSEKKAISLIRDRKNTAKKHSQMLPNTEKLLKSLLEPYNKKLEDLVGINWT